MKISYDLEESDDSGKHKFFSRLRPYLKALGYEEVPAGEKSDVHLFSHKPSNRTRCNGFRVDGIWVSKDVPDFLSRNKQIKAKMEAAAGVVFQNEFCKEAVRRIVSYVPSNHACILNGADKKEFDVIPYGHKKPYFLAMCKWRPHKRLRQIVEGFVAAEFSNHDLLVLGQTEPISHHPDVHYLGWKSKSDIARYVAGCVASVHLCWLDWCPNSVVESLVAGKQVIHTTSGGTKYVVQDRGYSVSDSDWSFKICKQDTPPELEPLKIAEAYRKSVDNPIEGFNTDDLDISNIAKQYSDFIKKTVKG
jgi:glycosyltransferase involved in cell wall biosynthesis